MLELLLEGFDLNRYIGVDVFKGATTYLGGL